MAKNIKYEGKHIKEWGEIIYTDKVQKSTIKLNHWQSQETEKTTLSRKQLKDKFMYEIIK